MNVRLQKNTYVRQGAFENTGIEGFWRDRQCMPLCRTCTGGMPLLHIRESVMGAFVNQLEHAKKEK